MSLVLATGTRADDKHIATFEAAWSLLATHFHDPGMAGLDWSAVKAELEPRARAAADDAAFARVLDDLTARLKTSHTAYLAPDDPLLPILLDVYSGNPALAEMIARRYGDKGPQLPGIGVVTARIDDRTFIDMVLNGSAAERGGLRLGDEIVAVDGKPFDAAALAARTGAPAAISIRRQAGGPVETVSVSVEQGRALDVINAASKASVRMIARDGRKIAYARLWSMAGTIAEEIAQMLPLQDADALVLDVRGLVGGGGTQFLDLLDPRFGQMCWRNRASHGCAPRSFRGRTVLLTDRHTRSGAEILAHGFRKLAFGKIVGQRTAGAVSGGRLFPLPNGGALYVAVSALQVDGVDLEGVGVTPDVAVPPAGPYAAGNDPQLDEALRVAAHLAP